MNSDINDLGPHIKRLSDAHGYKVEPGDPDPRGWTVSNTAGERIGVVEDLLVDTERMKVRYFDVRMESGAGSATGQRGSHALLDADAAQVSGNNGLIVRDISSMQFRDTAASGATGTRHAETDTDTRVTRSEEELRVGKRDVVSGEARVTKHVETEHVRQPVTTRHEELVIERRPVEAVTGHDATIGEDEIRIPLHSEEVVVDKRAVVKEEVVIGKRIVEERDTVEADVRRERLDVDEGTRGTENRTTRDPRRDEF